MHNGSDFVRPEGWTLQRKVLYDLGFFGHYLHYSAGGRSGQKRIIMHLAANDGHMTQRELQEQLDVRSGSISEVLAKVEGDGLVERSRSEEDRRQQEVRLTTRGRELASEYSREHDRFEEACLACLDDAEQKQLLALLDRTLDHWKSLSPTCPTTAPEEARA